MLTLEHVLDGSTTLPQLEALLAVVLAGRVAEEIAFQNGSVGAGVGPTSDLAVATGIARDIELKFGPGSLGPIHADIPANDLFLVNGLLGSFAARLRTAFERARNIIDKRWSEVQAITAALEREGYLAGTEIDALLYAAGSDVDAVRLDKSTMTEEVR